MGWPSAVGWLYSPTISEPVMVTFETRPASTSSIILVKVEFDLIGPAGDEEAIEREDRDDDGGQERRTFLMRVFSR